MSRRRRALSLLAAGLLSLMLAGAACGDGDDEFQDADGPGGGAAADASPASGGGAPGDDGGDDDRDRDTPGGAGGGDSVDLAAAMSSGDAVLLERRTVFDTDPLGLGGPALTILVPQGWDLQGGPVWRHQYSNLATYEGVVSSPDGFQGVQFFPIFPQIWQEGGIPFFPEGSNYLGNDVRPPIRDAAMFLEMLVLPNYRAPFGPRIIAREPLPDVAALWVANSLPGTEAVAERILTEHTVNGVTVQEEFTIALTYTPNPAIPGAMIWSPQEIFAIRAPAGELESARPLLQAIATSPVVDLNWFAGYQYVLDLSVQNGLEAIRAAGEASRIVSQANAEINDIIMDSYTQTQASRDRIHEAWTQTIRGIETYHDPFEAGTTLELPNGFTYAYGFENGTVLLTNEPRVDPRELFPGEVFELLEIKR